MHPFSKYPRSNFSSFPARHSRRSILRLIVCAGAGFALGGCSRKPEALPADVDYYTCTMHPSVRSRDPHGKCPICGMDLVPVFKTGSQAASAQGQTGEFVVPVARQQQIGVTYAAAEKRQLQSTLRAVGTVESDPSRRWSFVARVDGYVQQLFVTSPGETVEKDQPLVSIYSPDIFNAEQEFVALFGGGRASATLLAAARSRLIQRGVSERDIADLEKARRPVETLTLRSPFRGIVRQVTARQGASVKAGDPLAEAVDLSEVWVWADFYENELPMLRPGLAATVRIGADPARAFDGKIAAVDPFVDEIKRTARARIDIANPDLALRPGMYANVELAAQDRVGLAIPADAVMPGGVRDIVFVDKGGGRLEPRAVQLGGRYGDWYEVLGGLKEGERVVSSANFLIDAEARVQGALKDFATPEDSAQ